MDRCAYEGIPTKGAELHVTLSPCLECAKSIVACGITRVVYEITKRHNGLEYLEKHGVELCKLNS